VDKIWHNLKLDLADGGSQGEISVRANDATTQVLSIQLRTGGRVYQLAEDVVATLHGTRRDGTMLYNACYIEDNCIRMELKSELLGVAGRVECVIKLVGTEPAALTTPGFDIYVEAVPDDAKIEASDSFGALVEQTAKTKALQMEIEQKLADGEFDGEDGYSPEVTVTPIEDGYRLDVKNKDTEYSVDIIAPEKGEQGVGIASAVLNADYTLTLNFTDGSKYITPSIRGEKGEPGIGLPGAPGKDGDDGVSPKVSVAQLANGHRITIEDAYGVKTFDLLNGSNGAPGNDGVTPVFTIGTVTTLEAGSNATASIGGTADKPVLNLGIPKGKDGEDAEGGGGTMDHADLTNRDVADQHPMGAISGLEDALAGKQPAGEYLKNGDVPAWAMKGDKPSYTADEVGALSAGTAIPDELGDLKGDASHRTVTDAQISAWNAKSEFSGEYSDLKNIPEAPVTSVNGKTGAVKLDAAAVGARADNWMPTPAQVGAHPDTWMPTAAQVGAHPNTWMPTPAQVGADPTGTATSAVSSHNTNKDSHNDIRLLIAELTAKVTNFLDVDDTSRDQLSELLALIDAHAGDLESITNGKLNKSDVINNLTTNSSDKALSAAQGVVIKALIDALDSGKLDASKLSSAINTALAQAKASGEFNGKDGYTPVKGADYWTTADKAEIEAYIATELAKRGQLEPAYPEGETVDECLEWLAENGDKSKLYVLPDGMIYAWMLTEKEVSGGGYTNLLPSATDTDRKTIYGGDYNSDGVNDGYKTSTRLSGSSGSASSANAQVCTSGFIPAVLGDVVQIKNFYAPAGVATYVISYNASNARVANQTFPPCESYEQFWGDTQYGAVNALTWASVDQAAKTITITLTEALFGSGFNAIRFSGIIDDTTIVTVNQEIKESSSTIVKEEAWASTGHAFVPADYEPRIIEVEKRAFSNTERIISLEKAVENGGTGDATEAAALAKIKKWDKPVYDDSPVTLLSTEREKPALTASDRTVSAVYAKYRALMAKHPRYITETNLGKSTASDTFQAVDILRFDFKEPDGLVQSSSYTVNETKPKIILMCGVHNEYAGIYGVYYALEEIAENPEFDDIRRNAHIIVVPCSNPFGLTSQAQIDNWQMSHVNANGVAIHNNFGVEHNTYNANVPLGSLNYGGTEPYSELETQYIDRLMAENTDAIAFVTCHNFNQDLVFGSMAIWASSATAHMCNLAFRLIDKISKAWHNKYGSVLQEGIDAYKNDALPEGETRLGYAQFSTSAGTEQLNATKYGILATNLEISDNMRAFTNKQFSSEVMTHGAEVYANFFRTILASYDYNDKKEYAPNLPWSE
jgi:hypothetical protein